jgi:hypothetical protein
VQWGAPEQYLVAVPICCSHNANHFANSFPDSQNGLLFKVDLLSASSRVVPPKIALIVLHRWISRQTPLYDIKKLIGENQSKEKRQFATSATVKKVLSSISLITISPKCLRGFPSRTRK